MNTPTLGAGPVHGIEDFGDGASRVDARKRYSDLDPLVEIEARIARRADEIAAGLAMRTPLNLYCWLQAEQEILSRMKPADRWLDGVEVNLK